LNKKNVLKDTTTKNPLSLLCVGYKSVRDFVRNLKYLGRLLFLYKFLGRTNNMKINGKINEKRINNMRKAGILGLAILSLLGSSFSALAYSNNKNTDKTIDKNTVDKNIDIMSKIETKNQEEKSSFNKKQENNEKVSEKIDGDIKIKCPPGFWQSHSSTVPFCVNKAHETYKDTPVCLITDTCKVVNFKDIRHPLLYNSETILNNLQHYANAVNAGVIEDKLYTAKLQDIWPGTKNIITNWGTVASLACQYGKCNEAVVKFPIIEKLFAILNFDSGIIGLNWLTRNIISLGDLSESKKAVTLGSLPTTWFENAKINDVVNTFNLWEHTIDTAGYAQPTTQQAGMEYKQFIIVQKHTQSFHGVTDFYYDNRIPSDEVGPGENQGPNQVIISGTNRYIKDKCQVQGSQGGFNNCAHLKLRINKNVPEKGSYTLYLVVSGLKERLDGKGGGDVIAENTPFGMLQPLHDGDFRTPEIVGATNDEPLLPQGSNVHEGLNLDQCKIEKAVKAEYTSQEQLSNGILYKYVGKKKVPAYTGPYIQKVTHQNVIVPGYPQNPCPNRFRKQYHTKDVLVMDAEYSYIHTVPRKCYKRQLYRLLSGSPVGLAMGDLYMGKTKLGVATKEKEPIFACEGIEELQGGKVRKIDPLGSEPIKIPIRGGLLSRQQ